MRLDLSLLGKPEMRLDGNIVENLESEKARALLFYITAEADRSHRRAELAEMFWPNKPEGYGRNSLKQALAILRKALRDRDSEEPFLLTSNRDVHLNAGSSHWVDIAEFKKTIETVNKHAHQSVDTCESCAKNLMKVSDLYRGDFLAGFYLPDCQEFEEWVIVNREAYQRMASDFLRGLISYHERRKEYKQACTYSERLITLEPWSESSHRTSMRLLAMSGKRSAALKQYYDCVEILDNELGVTPTNETIELFEQIKEWEFGDFHSTEPNDKGEDLSPKPEKVFPRSSKLWLVGSAIVAFFVLAVFSLVLLARNNDWVFTKNFENASNTNSLDPTQDEEGVDFLSHISSNPKEELKALQAIYNATNGANWNRNDGWLSDNSHCDWYGIICVDGNLSEINLSGNKLDGSIPGEIGLLSTLRVLDLRNNFISGPIPPEIGNLSNLRTLLLDGNTHLNGSIPPEIGNLSNLEHLILSTHDGDGSEISGTLPVELGQLTNLITLQIDYCLIRGSIPLELGNLTKLRTLSLQTNQMSGQIPPEIYTLSHLDWLSLNGNIRLTGSLSPEIGQLKNLSILDLGYNNFTGTLPQELGELTRLRWLSIPDNAFEGTLPISLINLNISDFHFEHTELCEPDDPAFQEWLDTIYDLGRTGVLCSNDRN